MLRRRASVAIVGVLMVSALFVSVIATATPAAANTPATVGHCYFSPHNTQVHWDMSVIERKSWPGAR